MAGVAWQRAGAGREARKKEQLPNIWKHNNSIPSEITGMWNGRVSSKTYSIWEHFSGTRGNIVNIGTWNEIVVAFEFCYLQSNPFISKFPIHEVPFPSPTDSTPCVFPDIIILVHGSTALLPVLWSHQRCCLIGWARCCGVPWSMGARTDTHMRMSAHRHVHRRACKHTRPRMSSFPSLSDVLLPFMRVLFLSCSLLLLLPPCPAAPLFLAGEEKELPCKLNLLPLGFLLSCLNLYSRKGPVELNYVGTGHFCLFQWGKSPAACVCFGIAMQIWSEASPLCEVKLYLSSFLIKLAVSLKKQIISLTAGSYYQSPPLRCLFVLFCAKSHLPVLLA